MAAQGRYPTTLCAELNRLANGGAYPAPINMLDVDGAASKWAGTTATSAVEALNQKQGNALTAYRDIQGVCNQLAGTTNLGATEALREILA